MKKIKKYIFEFFLIFVSVILAFLLAEWSSGKEEKLTENKILMEISRGINSDLKDFESNIYGHRLSLRGISTFRNWLDHQSIEKDSVEIYYYFLLRDYIPVVNVSGYESLKINNLKTISNDSLRFEIINLYEYYYKIIQKLENELQETQDFANFYQPFNKIITPYIEFNQEGKIIGLTSPHRFSEVEIKEILSYLWRIENSKKFKISQYNIIIEEIRKLDNNIKKELENW